MAQAEVSITGAEIVIDELVSLGYKTCFSVSGGTMAFLLDALARRDEIEVVHCHHEQAASMAAESYARLSGRPALVLVSNGPAVTNTLTGVAAAHVDSVPLLIISGEVKDSARLDYSVPTLRQGGVQQVDTRMLVAPITKAFHHVKADEPIRQLVRTADHQARQDRPGPVWLQIPLDAQSQIIRGEPNRAIEKTPYAISSDKTTFFLDKSTRQLLSAAERPLVILGSGARLAPDLVSGLQTFGTCGVPVATTWGLRDMAWTLGENFVGSTGVSGDRSANLISYYCDLVVGIGTRLHVTHTGYNLTDFAPNATIVHLDIDESEASKLAPRPVHFRHCNMHDGLQVILGAIAEALTPDSRWLLNAISVTRQLSQIDEPHERQEGSVNTFDFVRSLQSVLPEKATVVLDAGTAYRGTLPTLRSQYGWRVIFAGGLASMGSGLPGIVGAHFVQDGSQLVGIFGDGGTQMNLQELETIKHHGIPAKMFILKDDGYMAISNTQRKWFDGRLEGSDLSGGLSTPDFVSVARAFGIQAARLDCQDVPGQLRAFLNLAGPALMEVPVPRHQTLMPRMDTRIEGSFLVSPPMHDMYPPLDREVLTELGRQLLGS